ncbi:hypothetical protein D3C76_846960 [compost metagenome]
MDTNFLRLAQGYFCAAAQLGQLGGTGIAQHLSRTLRRQRRETALQSLNIGIRRLLASEQSVDQGLFAIQGAVGQAVPEHLHAVRVLLCAACAE